MHSPPDNLHGIAAITFDVGGTLIEPWPSVGHIYAAVAARHAIGELSPEVLDRRFAAAWRAQKDFSYTRHAWANIVDETFRDLVTQPPSETFFPELYARFAQADCWRIFPDVAPTLNGLAARASGSGIISNWDERLRPLLQALGLARHFEVIVVSCEAGATKPSPAIFQQAAKQLGLPPETIVHVGDSAKLDVAGAQQAGWHAARIKRDTPPAIREDIQSLTYLLELIAG